MEPVFIEQVGECHFEAKPCALCGLPKSNRAHRPKKTAACSGKWPRGCNRCGRNKGDLAHFGAPPSLNLLSSGPGADNPHFYAGLKKTWQGLLAELLEDSDLPRGLGRVTVEGLVTFPTAGRRDQGNHRVLLEKALGDALTDGGWLEDDDWTRYEFGQLSMRVEPGVSATHLSIFPSPVVDPVDLPHPHEQMELTT